MFQICIPSQRRAKNLVDIQTVTHIVDQLQIFYEAAPKLHLDRPLLTGPSLTYSLCPKRQLWQATDPINTTACVEPIVSPFLHLPLPKCKRWGASVPRWRTIDRLA